MQVDIRRAYALVKPLIEEEALALRDKNPWLHLAHACTEVHRRRPLYWRIYRAAMAPDVRLPSEFQRARRLPGRLQPKHRAWNVIEDLARTLVAASREPLTLRDAVGRVVRANPELYRRYAAARTKGSRARPKRAH